MGYYCRTCEKIRRRDGATPAKQAIQHTRRIMLDGIAVAVAGTIQEEAPEVLAKHVRNLGGTPTSTVINFGFKTSPVEAAYVNGAAMRARLRADVAAREPSSLDHVAGGSGGTMEQRQSNGRDCLTAMVKGIEIMGWVREASHQDDIKTVRFHPPCHVRPARRGRRFKSHDRPRCRETPLRRRYIVAPSRAGSILANVGTMSKSTNCGHAVSEGVDAALLAECGFTANPDVIEHPRAMSLAISTNASNWKSF